MPPIDPQTRVRNAFAAAVKNGKIDGAEAERLIRSVKRERLTESEAKVFKAEVKRLSGSLTKEAKETLDGFIDKKIKKLTVLDPGPRANPGGRPDPKYVVIDTHRLEQQLVKGAKLFTNGVSHRDPVQNYIGDCYLIAAMGAVAKSNPEAIKKMFKENADGTFTVTLYERRGSRLLPKEITIDADLPRNDWYGYYYAKSKDEKELWPALLEKAVAMRDGGYGKIESGVAGDAMEWITGKPSEYIELRSRGVTADKIYAQLKAAFEAGHSVTSGTLAESSNAKYTNTNIYSDHAYSVLGVSTEKGEKYVHLRNPWGESEPQNNGRDDGVFKIPLAKFMDLFSDVSING